MNRLEIVNVLPSEGRIRSQVPTMILDFEGTFDMKAFDAELDAMAREGLVRWIHANGRKAEKVCTKLPDGKCRKAHYLYLTPKGIEHFADGLYESYAQYKPVNSEWVRLGKEEFVAAMIEDSNENAGF